MVFGLPPFRGWTLSGLWDLLLERNRIERCFNKLKNWRCLVTRYDKTTESYLGFVLIVAFRQWAHVFVNKT